MNPDAAAVTQVWAYIGELVFNMLVLVGAVKMSDRIIPVSYTHLDVYKRQHLYLNEEERSQVIQSLIALKNNLAAQGR